VGRHVTVGHRSVAVTAATPAWLDELVASTQSRGRMPSLALGVLRDGQLWHVSTAGDTPRATPDTQYRIGSITKTFTAVLLMRLRDEGRIDLDDPLQRHLPGTPLGHASLRQLLGHVSGLRREPSGAWWERVPGVTLDTLIAGMDEGFVLHPPYRTAHYSNLAYGLLGAVVTRVTGQPWLDLVRERVLRPLAMHRTSYQCEEPFARGYVVHPWLDALREEPRHDSGAMAPAGQLWSTVADLARWAGFLINPTPGVIHPDTVREMTVPVAVTDPESWTGGYGLGLQLLRRGERVYVGHGGSMPGYLALLLVHRQSATGAVAFCNSYNPTASIVDLCTSVIERIAVAEPATRSWRPATAPADVAPLCGRWWFMGQEHEAGYDPKTGQLVVRFLASDAVPPWLFVPDGTDHWRCVSEGNHGERLTVRRAEDGTVSTLDIATYEFTRDPWPRL
jgi:CubicO group peptidase (beta-lactamase class C family)